MGTQNTQAHVQDLLGKVAVVTGASRGIGRSIALEFARHGADVMVHARRDSSAAREVAEEIRGMGRQSHVVLYDLTDPKHQKWLVHEGWSSRDGFDIWVNNAGVDVLTGESASLSFDEKLDRLWAVDVKAVIVLSRLAGNLMKDHGGSILNIGWDQAETGMAGDSGEMFATIKGAVMAFSRSLAKSLAPSVRVNCLAPGWIRTAWGESTSEYWNDRACGESLMERWGTAEDVAKMARFLVSAEASFINSQIIAVNGGFRSTVERAVVPS